MTLTDLHTTIASFWLFPSPSFFSRRRFLPAGSLSRELCWCDRLSLPLFKLPMFKSSIDLILDMTHLYRPLLSPFLWVHEPENVFSFSTARKQRVCSMSFSQLTFVDMTGLDRELLRTGLGNSSYPRTESEFPFHSFPKCSELLSFYLVPNRLEWIPSHRWIQFFLFPFLNFCVIVY